MRALILINKLVNKYLINYATMWALFIPLLLTIIYALINRFYLEKPFENDFLIISIVFFATQFFVMQIHMKIMDKRTILIFNLMNLHKEYAKYRNYMSFMYDLPFNSSEAKYASAQKNASEFGEFIQKKDGLSQKLQEQLRMFFAEIDSIRNFGYLNKSVEQSQKYYHELIVVILEIEKLININAKEQIKFFIDFPKNLEMQENKEKTIYELDTVFSILVLKITIDSQGTLNPDKIFNKIWSEISGSLFC